MFIAALFITTKQWNQPSYPTTNEWIKKMLYKYTKECYSAIKKNKIMSFVGMWMEMEDHHAE
jgi:hypothetical protein